MLLILTYRPFYTFFRRGSSANQLPYIHFFSFPPIHLLFCVKDGGGPFSLSYGKYMRKKIHIRNDPKRAILVGDFLLISTDFGSERSQTIYKFPCKQCI